MNSRTKVLLFLCLAALPSMGLPAPDRSAQSDNKARPPAQSGGGEPIEEVQDVSAVEPVAQQGAGSVIGKLHPALVHFPIAWVMLVQVMDLAAIVSRRKEWTTVGLYLLMLACLSFIPAAATGLIRAGAMGKDPEIQNSSHLPSELEYCCRFDLLGRTGGSACDAKQLAGKVEMGLLSAHVDRRRGALHRRPPGGQDGLWVRLPAVLRRKLHCASI